MAHAGLLLGHGFFLVGRNGVALADQLEQVKAGVAAHHRGDLARRQLDERLGEQRRQAVRVAPADFATLERVRRVRISGGDLGEIGAGAQLARHFVGARLAGGDLLGRGVFGNSHHDLRDVHFDLVGNGGLLGGQISVDFGVGNLDLVVDFMLAQALHHHFVADLFAESGVRHAFLFHLVAHLLQRHLLLLGDAADRAVEFLIADLDAHFLGQLLLRALDDHRLKYLALQVGGGGNRRAGRLHACFDRAHPRGNFIFRDDVVVDHHRDRIDDVGRTGRWRPGAAGRLSGGSGGGGGSGRLGRLSCGLAGSERTQQESCGLQLVHTDIAHNLGNTHIQLNEKNRSCRAA